MVVVITDTDNEFDYAYDILFVDNSCFGRTGEGTGFYFTFYSLKCTRDDDRWVVRGLFVGGVCLLLKYAF